jgi:hypothetical protein
MEREAEISDYRYEIVANVVGTSTNVDKCVCRGLFNKHS